MIPIYYRGTFVAYAYSGQGFSKVRAIVRQEIPHDDFFLYYDDDEQTPFLNGNRLTWKDKKLIIKRTSEREEKFADAVIMAMLKTLPNE